MAENKISSIKIRGVRDRRSLKGTFYPNEQHLYPEPDWAAYFAEKRNQEELLKGNKLNA